MENPIYFSVKVGNRKIYYMLIDGKRIVMFERIEFDIEI